MKRTAAAPSISAENSLSSVGSSSSAHAGRPPFLSSSSNGMLGRRFHASTASRTPAPQHAPLAATASQSLASTLGLFPRAGASPMPVPSNTRQQQGIADSQTAPQPDVKIKTRDSTSASRRAAVRQSGGHDAGYGSKIAAAGQMRTSNSLNPHVQPLRSPKHAELRTSGAAAAANDSLSPLQSPSADSCSTVAIQPRALKAFSSLQQLSPISEVGHASLSSSGFSRDAVGCDGGSDDGSAHDSALYTLSPLLSLQTGQALAVSDNADQIVSRSAASMQLQSSSPVQRQAQPVFDACNGDTLILNMHALIAEPAPMLVLPRHSFLRVFVPFFHALRSAFPVRVCTLALCPTPPMLPATCHRRSPCSHNGAAKHCSLRMHHHHHHHQLSTKSFVTRISSLVTLRPEPPQRFSLRCNQRLWIRKAALQRLLLKTTTFITCSIICLLLHHLTANATSAIPLHPSCEWAMLGRC